MRCPWCGAPVMIRGNRWECGYCGDFGNLRRKPVPEEPEEEPVNAPPNWVFEDARARLEAVCPNKYRELTALLPAVLCREIGLSLSDENHTEDPAKFRQLQAFLEENNLTTAAALLRAVQSGQIPFSQEAELSYDRAGIFWQTLAAGLSGRELPEDINVFLCDLALLYQYYRDDGPIGDTGEDRLLELQELLSNL